MRAKDNIYDTLRDSPWLTDLGDSTIDQIAEDIVIRLGVDKWDTDYPDWNDDNYL